MKETEDHVTTDVQADSLKAEDVFVERLAEILFDQLQSPSWSQSCEQRSSASPLK